MQLLDFTPHDCKWTRPIHLWRLSEKSYAVIPFTSADSNKYKTKIMTKKIPWIVPFRKSLFCSLTSNFGPWHFQCFLLRLFYLKLVFLLASVMCPSLQTQSFWTVFGNLSPLFSKWFWGRLLLEVILRGLPDGAWGTYFHFCRSINW